MKVKDQLRAFREDGTLNILINMNKYEPAILDYLEWWDFFDAEKAKGNRKARRATCMRFQHCSYDKFDYLRSLFEADVPDVDWIAKWTGSARV